MNLSLKISFLFLFFSIINKSNAQYIEFVENKGQWEEKISFKGDMKLGAIALKKDGGYRMLQHNADDIDAIGNFFHPTHKKDSNIKSKIIKPKELGLRSHVYEVSFLGSNKNPQSYPEKVLETFNNYFIGNDKSKWASGCKVFTAIVYKNIYPNIDVRYYTNNGQLKYDFIINPGANPNNIFLNFDGVDELKIKNDNLLINTSVGTITENKPYSFQPSENGKNEVDCSFKLIGNLLTFRIGEYDNSKPLVIDPSISFCSFTGSLADNWGFTATYDAQGNLYGGGIVFGPGFPANNGSSYQGGIVSNDEGSNYDIGIIKFNSTGSRRIYATYIGGRNGNDQPHSLVEDGRGNLVISGRTGATDYPTTLPDAGPCGGRDIILTILNPSGNIVASRKIGGTGDDGINIKAKNAPPINNRSISLTRNYGDDARSEVIVDDEKNILLASCTQSSDFYTTANAFQTFNASAGNGYKQDGVFIKTNSNLSNILVSSYLGGNSDDAAFVLSISPTTKEIFIGGGTISTNLQGTSSSVLAEKFNGGECDGFITVLNSVGTQINRTTYIGTNLMDIIYGLQHDKNGFVYITGATKSPDWPVINAPYFNTKALQFICKLKPDLSNYVYSTTFGSPNARFPNISTTAFLVDRCENVYVSGWGGEVNRERKYESAGTTGMPTANRINFPFYSSGTPTDGSDFYFFVLARDAKNLLYGDFFGQRNGNIEEHVDGGTSRFDRNGIIYQAICANCNSRDIVNFPTTPGVFADRNGSTICNLAVLKLNFNLAGIGAGIKSSIRYNGDTTGCIPLTINFTDTLNQGKKYIWNFGDGSLPLTTTTANVSHSYNVVGNYKVCVYAIDSSSCNISDTSCRTMRLRDDPATLKATFRKVGNCFDRTFAFDNTASTAPITKPFKVNSFTIDFGDGSPIEQMGYDNNKTHSYVNEGFYNVRITLTDTTYCNAPADSILKLRVVANLKASQVLSSKPCLGKPIQFINKSNGGEFFKWYFGDGDSSIEESPFHTYKATGAYIVRFIVWDSLSCNKVDDTLFTVNVLPSAIAKFTYNPIPPRVNTPVNFVNTSLNATSYQWDLGDGTIINTTQISPPIAHLFNRTRTFEVRLTAFNKDGCSSTDSAFIQARVNQYFDVANAFAPTGNNRIIYVKGFGIRKMQWNIYNRWGKLLFTSTDINTGWDGRYNGELQPQEVYHYTLVVDYWDDTKETKTGDITLLR